MKQDMKDATGECDCRIEYFQHKPLTARREFDKKIG